LHACMMGSARPHTQTPESLEKSHHVVAHKSSKTRQILKTKVHR